LSTSYSYPLSEKHSDRLKTPSGIAFSEITLQAVLDGRIRMEDLRVTTEALGMQAQIAEAAGRTQLAENLRRAAELVNLPDDVILAIYAALRPGRAERAELEKLAGMLEQRYHARHCAALIREAALA
jgi:propanediol dehydratase small subunit